IVRRVLVRRTDSRTFGAGAVVADNVDDQRVVELAQIIDRLDYPTDFVVGVGSIGGEDFRLTRKQLFLIGRWRVRFLQVVRPGSELCTGRNYAQPFLVGEDLLPQLIPTHVELPLELFDPLLLRLVW